MSAFAAHLHKELRDQRPTLAKLALILVALTACGAFAIPGATIAQGQLVQPMLVIGGLIGAIAVAVELVPAEGQRGTLALLTRLPRGLRRAFWAKAGTVALASLAFAALGFVTAMLCWQLRFSPGWFNPLPGKADFYPALLWVGLGAAFWVMAIASWMPRGLPALFVPPLLAVPHVVVWRAVGAGLDPESGHGTSRVAWSWLIEDDLGWVLLSQPLLALAVAWVSFVPGRRWSGGALASARQGGLATLLALGPAWGALAWRANEWTRPPDAATAQSWFSLAVGGGGRYGFDLRARADGWPIHSFAIELATGNAIPLGSRGDRVHPWTQTFRAFPRDPGQCDYVTLGKPDGSSAILDARDLSVVGETRYPFAIEGRLQELFRASLRARTTLRDGDGRRAWVLGDRLEIEAGAGAVESVPLEPKDAFVQSAIGSGLRLRASDSEYRVYDLHRRRSFAQRYPFRTEILCLGSCWVIRDQPERGRRGTWELLDPDTGVRSPLPRDVASGNVVCALPPGRMLMSLGGAEGEAKRLVLATFPGGTVTEVGLPDGFDAPKGWGILAQSGEQTLGPGESEVLLSLWGKATCVTTYRPGDGRLGRAIEAFQLIGRIDRDTVLARSNRDGSLERIDLRSGARSPVRLRDAR